MTLVLEENPYENFVYALRAPESKRQYPRRFKVFLDFLHPEIEKVPFNEIEKQANAFYSLAIKNKNWVNTELKDFVSFQIKRAIKGEISYMTIRNYYRATKLFCEMNEIELSWKKISRGIPKGREHGDEVIKLNPEHAGAYANKGAILSSLGENERAIECYDKFLEFDNNNISGLLRKAYSLIQLNRKTEASPLIDKARVIDPNNQFLLELEKSLSL
jgi:tetratricopeptide (TPR) repeat protein